MTGELLTEQRNEAAAGIDLLSTEEMLRVMNLEDARIAAAVEAEIPRIAAAVDAIVHCLEAGGRLYYIGAGTSGRLGVLDASECPPTFNAPPEWVQGIIAGGEAALARAAEASEDDAQSGADDLLAHGFRTGDILAGIAASGRTPYVLGALRQARELGAVTIGISCVPGSQVAHAAGIAITPATGPEVIAGSTRLKAGTATKLVLNMLTTGTFIRMGFVFGNLMVNVEPKNDKLKDRALRIIQSACSLPLEDAAALLKEAGNRVQTAIVMNLAGVNVAEAAARLSSARGNVRKAIQGVSLLDQQQGNQRG